MKQKYKVFINDHVLEFIGNNSGNSGITIYNSDDYDPLALVEKLAATSVGSPVHVYIRSEEPAESYRKFAAHFKLIAAAGGVVRLNEDDSPLLLIHRLGKWDLPKGKLEKGEDARDGALREVEEECGISNLKITETLPITRHMYVHHGKWVLKETHWFCMVTRDRGIPVPQTDEGITEVRWVGVKELGVCLDNSYASIRDLLVETVLNR
jgi:8-oxo-dGTP pyrophosphatase MutT (NUDIX family)